MAQTISAVLLLAAAASAARPTVQVESPDGRTAIEMPAGSPKQLAERCTVMGKDYAARPTPEGIDELFFCLSHPDWHTRYRTLDEMDRFIPTDRADFRTVMLPRLKQAVRIGSVDPVNDVRYSAGALSRDLEHWETFHPPPSRDRRRASDWTFIAFALWMFLLWLPRARIRRKRR